MKNQFIEKKLEEFDKNYTVYHPGHSGVGGNDPQEPVYEITTDASDVRRFLTTALTEALLAGIELAEGVTNDVLRDSRTIEEVYAIGKREDIARTQAFVDIKVKLTSLKESISSNKSV